MEQMNTNQKQGAEKVQLMLTDTELEIQQVQSQSRSRDIRKEQVDSNDSQFRNKNMKARNKNWRENKIVGNGELLRSLENTKKNDNEEAILEKEEVDNGPNKAKWKPRGRKWKLQARSTKAEKVGVNGPVNVKRSNSEISWPNSENKKKLLLSPLKQLHEGSYLSPSKQAYSQNHLRPHRAVRKLKLVDKELDAWGILKAMEEDLSAGAGRQPRRQP